MDKPFDPTAWNPTQCPQTPGETGDMAPEMLQQLMKDLIRETKNILRYSYEPRNWLARALVLSRLRYPELAFGDAIKTWLLCQGFLDRLNQGDSWNLGYKCGFWMLDAEGMTEDSAAEEMREALAIRFKFLQECTLQIESSCMFPSVFGEPCGKFIPREYPWMEDRHRHRSDDLIAQFNSVFATRAPRSSRAEGPFCELRRHALGKDSTGLIDTSEILGVFALRYIPKDTLVLIDRTQHFGCIALVQRGSEIDSDSSSSSKILHPNLSDDSTDDSLQWIRDEAGSNAAEILLTCRFLLGCVIHPEITHPLDSLTIASLTPKYHTTKTSKFRRQENYMIPIRYLQQIGIDIFATLTYDTWILFTLRARIANNSCESCIHEYVFPLFSFLNHACCPNLTWTMRSRKRRHKSLFLRTVSDVRAGEQLFVEYDSFVHDQALEIRRARLRKWFDADCACMRCLAEESEILTLREAVDKGETVVPDMSAWDTEDKPVLPEDSV